jgi:hypothetical protein
MGFNYIRDFWALGFEMTCFSSTLSTPCSLLARHACLVERRLSAHHVFALRLNEDQPPAMSPAA